MKQIKNYSYATLFAVALLFSGIAYAESTNGLNGSDKVQIEGKCLAQADVILKNGDTVHIEGSCAGVRRQIKKSFEAELRELTLENGNTVHLEGSHASVRRQIRKYKKAGLLK